MTGWVAVAVPLMSAVLGAGVGGVIVHRATSARDARNEQRGRRVEHLISAYRRLIIASNRGAETTLQHFADLEAAISDVMLLGQRAEVEAAGRFARHLNETHEANLDELLSELRDSLRAELNLDHTPLPDLFNLRFQEITVPASRKRGRSLRTQR